MSASGMLRSDDVIFYHPLDDFTEHTQDQLWSGGAVFVPGEIDDACAGISGDTFVFDSRYDSLITDTDGKTPHAIRLDETHSVLIVSNSLVKVASVSGTSVTFSAQAAGGSWYDAILARNDEEDYWRLAITALNKIGLYTVNKSTYSITWDGYTTMSGVNNIGALGGDGRFLAIDTNGIATVCSVSGTSISFGSGIAYTSATSFLPTAVAGLSSGCAVVVFRNNDAPRNGAAVAVVATVSETDISFGAETQITANDFAIVADNDDRRAYVAEMSSSGFILAGRQQVSPYDGYAYIGVVSGTNVNFGSGAKFYSGTGSQRGPESIHAGYPVGSKVPISYYVRWSNPSWYSKAFCNVFTVSGTTIDVGTPIEFYGDSVGGYTIGAASVFLTQNKLIAQYRDEVDGNKTKVTIGQPSLEAEMSAVTPVVYPVGSGNSRTVIAIWATNITKELSTITVQRDYKITLNGTTIELGPDSVSWSDVEALGAGQMNDGSSHLLVLDFEHIANGVWNLNTSYDGGTWVNEGSGTGTRTISPSSLSPGLQIEGGFSDQWVDELVIWGGDKATFDQFTSDELINLYNLASIREQGMDKYDEGPLLLSSSCDLLTVSIGSIAASGDLFIRGHGEIQLSGDLFISGPKSVTTSGSLFVDGYTTIQVSGDLHINGRESQSISGSLYVDGHLITSVSGNLSIFGYETVSKLGNLFTQGVDNRAIYWADSVIGKIQRSLLDGTNIADVVSTDLPEIQSLVIDSENDKIYFGDAISDKIERVNPNGTQREDILISGLDRVRGMAISCNIQKLYWADAGLRTIKRSNFDGSNVETIVSLGVGSILQRIAIHDSEGKMYWTDENLSGPTIKKSNLDGTSIQTIITSSLTQPREIAVDTVMDKIYWVDAIDDSVEQADLDGNNRITISTIDGPQAIAIDIWEQKLYVGNWIGKIYKLNVDGSNKTEIVDTGGVIRAIDFGFMDYVPSQSGSISLFIFAPPPDIYDIMPLYLYGPGSEISSCDLFVCGFDSLAAPCNLFTFAPPPDIYDTRLLYVRAPEPETNCINMFVSGRGSSTWTISPRIDQLLKTYDYNPQLIGLLDTLASGVTIEVWDITGGANTVATLVNNVCYSIGTTSRWGWSTANLPTYRGYKKHYFYRMTSNLGDTFEGQFLLDVPEHARWIHPANQSEYIK